MIMYFSEIEMISSLLLSTLCGGLIGLERELRFKDAGISTHILICVASSLFSLLSGIIDPYSTSRIASAIVTGVGFIGAGIILKKDSKITGLTTAASIWSTASVGMAIGFGYYLLAAVGTLITVFAPKIPNVYGKNYTKKKKEYLKRFKVE